ncbi:unnamed protein product [Brassica oleracea]|uniref:Uncharacterized protein n=1 Tax=Brassica oleracea TaxID=3712 RepID=A0A3P6EFZ0_BRAOL|nr:unnamed protein product [Brassica oleracea]
MCGEIFEYNGSAVVAMVGKNCFAIVGSVFSSRRLPPISRESPRSTTVSSSASLFLLFLGGMDGRYQRLVFRHKLYQLREERDMKPETFASLVGVDSLMMMHTHIIWSWLKILLYLEYSSLCPSPWDVLCYVENFCVASLAKAALILIVAYLFLFFIYIKSHENQMETNYHISISCLNFPVDIFLRIDNDWTSHRPTEPEVQSHCQKYQKDGNCNTERLLSLKELYCSRSQGHV